MSERDRAVTAFLGILSLVVLGYGVLTGRFLLAIVVVVLVAFTYYLARAVGALERSAAALEAQVPDDQSPDGDPDSADSRWDRLDDEDRGRADGHGRGEERSGDDVLESDRTD